MRVVIQYKSYETENRPKKIVPLIYNAAKK